MKSGDAALSAVPGIHNVRDAEYVQYQVRALGSPATSSLLRALNANYFSTMPRLTASLVRRNPPQSLATSAGHMQLARQGLRSRKKTPPVSMMGPASPPSNTSSTAASALASSPVDDHTDATGATTNSPADTATSPTATTTASATADVFDSDDLTPHTPLATIMTRAEWTSADLIDRFPLKSLSGNKYVLIRLPFSRVYPRGTRENQISKGVHCCV